MLRKEQESCNGRDVFYWILNMAVISTLFCVIILLLRKIPWLSRNFIYALYGILLIRLILLFGIKSRFSFLHLLPQGMMHSVETEKGQMLSMRNVIQSAVSNHPLEQSSNTWTKVYQIGAVVWLIIVAAFLLNYMVMYIAAKRELHKARRLREEIY